MPAFGPEGMVFLASFVVGHRINHYYTIAIGILKGLSFYSGTGVTEEAVYKIRHGGGTISPESGGKSKGKKGLGDKVLPPGAIDLKGLALMVAPIEMERRHIQFHSDTLAAAQEPYLKQQLAKHLKLSAAVKHECWDWTNNACLSMVVVIITFAFGDVYACVEGKAHSDAVVFPLVIGAIACCVILGGLLKVYAGHWTEVKMSLYAGLGAAIVGFILLHSPPSILDFRLYEGYLELAATWNKWMRRHDLVLFDWQLSYGWVLLSAALLCGSYTSVTILPIFRWARGHRLMMLNEGTHRLIKAGLNFEFWFTGFCILLWFRPLVDFIVASDLRPCHVRAPFWECTEHGAEEGQDGSLFGLTITEAHFGTFRLFCIAAICIVRLALVRPYMQTHLDGGMDVVVVEMLRDKECPVAIIRNKIKTPYNVMHIAALQYLIPVFLFTSMSLLFKHKGQQSLFVCSAARAVVGAASPYNEGTANSTANSIFWYPMLGFFLWWMCVSNFIGNTLGLMYFAGAQKKAPVAASPVPGVEKESDNKSK